MVDTYQLPQSIALAVSYDRAELLNLVDDEALLAKDVRRLLVDLISDRQHALAAVRDAKETVEQSQRHLEAAVAKCEAAERRLLGLEDPEDEDGS